MLTYADGVEGGGLLGVTRFGAHNWEGTGMRSALAALQFLAKWTEGGKWHYQTTYAHGC
jgi:hypothetical protein